MIKLFDYWALQLYYFSRMVRNDDLVWFRANLLLGLFVLMGITTLFDSVALLWEYFQKGSAFFQFAQIYSEMIYYIIGGGTGVVTIFYYTKYKDPQKIEERFRALSRCKRIIYKIIIGLIEIGLPIGLFYSYRMVVFGYV